MKIKNGIASILALSIILSLLPFSAVSASSEIWDGSTAMGFASGDGTESNPYIITNGAELVYLKDIDTTGLYFALGNDIVLNNTSGAYWYKGGNNWPYIEFKGNLDGKGFSVKGLCVSIISRYEYTGLFGKISNARITNLKIENAYLLGASYIGGFAGEARDSYIGNCEFSGNIYSYKKLVQYPEGCVGGIAGQVIGANSRSFIENCHNRGEIYSDVSFISGIAGYVKANVKISNCNNYGKISAGDRGGGIAGIVDGNQISISDCCNYGTVASVLDIDGFDIGGIAGEARNGKITNCHNFGNVSSCEKAGGIVGNGIGNGGGNVLEISYCVNYGTVSGNEEVGGIIGRQGGSAKLSYLINRGTLNGLTYKSEEYSTYKTFGGIVGYSEGGQWENVYNYSDIYVEQNAGGIIGISGTGTEIQKAYNCGAIQTNIQCSGGIVGYAQDTTIGNSLNEGRISGYSSVGGIAGRGLAVEKIYFSQCENRGIISGIETVGGIVGYVQNGEIKDCLHSGILGVNENEGNKALFDCGGGIIGFNSFGTTTVENCVSAGIVVAAPGSHAGGLVGCRRGTVQLKNSYYGATSYVELGVATYTTTQSSTIKTLTSEDLGSYRLLEAELADKNSFEALDFDEIWAMGEKHPVLKNVASSVLGDVNSDGVTDKKDYAILKRFCFGTVGFYVGQKIFADVNGDGEVDKKDYALIKRACFGTVEIK